MDINKIIEEGEKEFENFIFAVKYKQNGTEMIDFDYHAEEREKLKQFFTSQQHKLLQSIVEMIDGMYYTNMTIEKPPTCDNESCTAKNSYNQGLSELKAKLTINIKE